MIDWVVGHLAQSWAPPLLTVPALLFGIAAIFAFDRLALRLLPARGATVATFAYALHPAACFTLSGYPTSPVNLALIIMFSAMIDRRVLLASGWAGLATSAAPLAAVAAAAVPLQGVATAFGGPCRMLWSRTVALGKAAPAVLAVSGLALSGIIGFVFYQVVRFGSSTAFIAAQHAWGSADAGTRLVRALTLFPLSYYYGQPVLGAATAVDRNRVEMFLQSELGVA